MKNPKKGPAKQPGRSGGKVRQHVSLTPNLTKAAEYLGRESFGNKTAYLEHLIMKDMERQNLTIADIQRLSAEWEAAQAKKKKPKRTIAMPLTAPRKRGGFEGNDVPLST